MPFLAGNGYGFLPLEATNQWAEEVYEVRGTPTNLLIDGEGRVIFKPSIRNAEELRVFELEVETLLRRTKS